MSKVSKESLEAKYKRLKKRVADMEHINYELWEQLHSSQIRVMQLESELSYIRDNGGTHD